jgi:hypothetical protein
MQSSVLKFLSSFILVSFFTVNLCFAKSSPDLLRADSLFQQKRYIQSLEIYQTIFKQQQYSPAMLLRMAYIHEGLNQVAQSVYYLNLYYLATQEDAVLDKMDELAAKYRLEGYARTDADSFLSLYHKNRTTITVAFTIVLIFLFSIILVTRFQFKRRPVVVWTLTLLLSVLLMWHLNIGDGRTFAIISKNNTYLMDGPSGGASVVSIVRDGHRVKIKGKKDVWVRVQWGEKEVFIKENNLLPVLL